MGGRKLSRLALVLLGVALAGTLGWRPARSDGQEADVEAILGKLDSPRGVCAILGDEGAGLAIRLARASELLVHVQLADARDVQAARQAAHSAGLFGSRVYVEQGDYARVLLADNVADVIVVRKSAQRRVSKEELLRVLQPEGTAFLGTTTLFKPFPENVDEWSHPYHGPDNNPQSTDARARAPYLTQFLAEPWYCPMPEVTVVSGGRVFKAFGNRAFKRPQWPMLNTLIAMNGYNGTILWKRELDPDFMIHRNTMIATPETLYLADGVSCKLFDAATGALKDEIVVREDLSDGPVWKWMALKDGVLYVLCGEQEPPGDKLKGSPFRGAGWPWWKVANYAWGFGRTIMAIDPADKKVLWAHRETEPIDTRAMCMNEDQLYFYSPEKFLGCLDTHSGELLWKTDDSEVIDAVADRHAAQRARWGFATTAFAKCSDEAIYFAGPQQNRLVAVSTSDGSLLWQRPKGNYQLVLREEGLYAMGSTEPSMKLDPLTGELLLELPNRQNCTRATGSVDRIFVRGGGTRCWDVADEQWLHISPMRPACHDGVVVAGGQLYWGPWMCGCNLSLLGVIALEPADDFDFSKKATEAERLELATDAPSKVSALTPSADDWPTFRKDNARSTRIRAPLATEVALRWEYKFPGQNIPTAPVAVGGLVFLSGSDGAVTALDAASGEARWTAYTGGTVKYPPSIAEGRALVGSGDGWIYAFEATSGRRLWRFRAAPVERRIPVYGALCSTWPVGSGVLVEDGVAYAAAGIANYDGTHVFALDAATGKIGWQNSSSGNTEGGQGAGVSVQGHLLLANGKLYLSGGNRVPVASYDLVDGTFQPGGAGRGKDLFLVADDRVVARGRWPLYTRTEDVHYIEQAVLRCPLGSIAATTDTLGLFQPGDAATAKDAKQNPKPKQVWTSKPFSENVALAVAENAVVVVGTQRRFESPEATPTETFGVTALDINTGKPLWSHPLPAAAVSWGLALGREGRILVALRDGRIVCFGPQQG
jgi:outer membrane protein assembly factor BamB